MAVAKKTKGPEFLRFVPPVVDALNALGGSGRPAEVMDWIVNALNISDEEQDVLNSNGQSRFANQVHWARFYLAKAGYIDSSERGVWTLTEQGLSSQLTRADALKVFQTVRQNVKKSKQLAEQGESTRVDDDTEEPQLEDPTNFRTELMGILLSIPASGFERLCQRLLRESGFQQVKVTGTSGDGGIDGTGLLQINPFVSFQVLFQCKRYSGSVGSSQVRDFRGAMMGRADKGIIMSTGTFTRDARNEAVRDGVPPIELVNGEKLLDMFEELELGLKPITTYQVDADFFEDFKV